LPSKGYSFGTTEEKIGEETNRTVITFQNIDAANYLYVSDTAGRALSDGVRINPSGSFTVRKADGEEPEKAFFVVASAANTTARIYTEYDDYPFVHVVSYPTEGTSTPIPTTPPSSGNGSTPSNGNTGGSTCLFSSFVPFPPLLNRLRHLRDTNFPKKLSQLYYQIPYPKQPIYRSVLNVFK